MDSEREDAFLEKEGVMTTDQLLNEVLKGFARTQTSAFSFCCDDDATDTASDDDHITNVSEPDFFPHSSQFTIHTSHE